MFVNSWEKYLLFKLHVLQDEITGMQDLIYMKNTKVPNYILSQPTIHFPKLVSCDSF